MVIDFDWMKRTDFGEERVLNNLVGRQSPADDVQLEDFRQFLLVGEEGVQIGLADPAESLVGRGQESEGSVTGDALHEVDGVVLHDAVELVEDPVALFLQDTQREGVSGNRARIVSRGPDSSARRKT